jgi:hypothetical protein
MMRTRRNHFDQRQQGLKQILQLIAALSAVRTAVRGGFLNPPMGLPELAGAT